MCSAVRAVLLGPIRHMSGSPRPPTNTAAADGLTDRRVDRTCDERRVPVLTALAAVARIPSVQPLEIACLTSPPIAHRTIPDTYIDGNIRMQFCVLGATARGLRASQSQLGF